MRDGAVCHIRAISAEVTYQRSAPTHRGEQHSWGGHPHGPILTIGLGRAIVLRYHQSNLWEVGPHPVRVSSDEL